MSIRDGQPRITTQMRSSPIQTASSVKPSSLPVQVVLVSVVLFLCGCSTLSNGRGWGQDATIKPGWEAVRESAVRAAKSPYTWAPLAGALLLQIDDWDKNISSWASRKTPVFGSQQSAHDTSDVLRNFLVAAMLVTAIATPSGDTSGDWLAAKGKGLSVVAAANLLNGGVTSSLKNWSDRTRPDGSGRDSFPSGHSSIATLSATLAARNLQSVDIDANFRRTMEISFGVFAAGTAWARVEANVHYPSDVLVGAAIGHFFAAFINDAFMGLNESDIKAIKLSLAPEFVAIQFQVGF